MDIEKIKQENKMLRETISAMKDVLRFCARNDVGTYYQQQAAKEMLLNNNHLIWNEHNPDGTYTEEYKKGIKERYSGAEAANILNRINAIESELLNKSK